MSSRDDEAPSPAVLAQGSAGAARVRNASVAMKLEERHPIACAVRGFPVVCAEDQRWPNKASLIVADAFSVRTTTRRYTDLTGRALHTLH